MEDFRGVPQSLQANAWAYLQLGHDLLFPNPLDSLVINNPAILRHIMI
jgi:hypothetical protein